MAKRPRLLVDWVGAKVKTRHKIYQSPTSNDPDVPRGKTEYVEDYDSPNLIVDFGGNYGHVLCRTYELSFLKQSGFFG